MSENSTEEKHKWIAEEAYCDLSYCVHPIARYLTRECAIESEDREKTDETN
ncbi:MAG: hypothetical protein KAH31_04790 [Candidatus Sabulitectum sp.]|nr:hypothetical protein [Candidatus Sabulitectum sp.]